MYLNRFSNFVPVIYILMLTVCVLNGVLSAFCCFESRPLFGIRCSRANCSNESFMCCDSAHIQYQSTIFFIHYHSGRNGNAKFFTIASYFRLKTVSKIFWDSGEALQERPQSGILRPRIVGHCEHRITQTCPQLHGSNTSAQFPLRAYARIWQHWILITMNFGSWISPWLSSSLPCNGAYSLALSLWSY